jgi:hypothetical protein
MWPKHQVTLSPLLHSKKPSFQVKLDETCAAIAFANSGFSAINNLLIDLPYLLDLLINKPIGKNIPL